MTGKKAGGENVAEPAGHGYAHTYEAGILVNLTDNLGITVGYNRFNIELEGHGGAASQDVDSDLFAVGVRFTY